MTEIQLALVLLGAFWAGTSSVFAGIRLTSEVRDRIVVGRIGDHELPIKHIRRLLVMEWLPLKLALAVISMVLGIIILALPGLRQSAPAENGFRTVCYVAAIMPFAGFVYQIVAAVVEGLYLRETVIERELAKPTDDLEKEPVTK